MGGFAVNIHANVLGHLQSKAEPTFSIKSIISF